MNVEDWIGASFTVRDHASGVVVHTGAIALRAEDTTISINGGLIPLTGETILELDFSSLATVGTYHLQVDGVGISRSFKVGRDALGEAFYIHARGLFHQRCGTNLTAEHTRWERDDVHRTLKGGHPPRRQRLQRSQRRQLGVA